MAANLLDKSATSTSNTPGMRIGKSKIATSDATKMINKVVRAANY